MTLSEGYVIVIRKIIDEFVAHLPESREEGIVLGNFSLELPIGQFDSILSDLVKIGAITELGRQNDPDGTNENGLAYDEQGFTLTTKYFQHVKVSISDMNVLEQKLSHIEKGIEKSKEVFDSSRKSDDVYREVANVSGFKAHADGSVFFNEKPFECRAQLKRLFIALLQNHGETTNYEAIKDSIGDEYMQNETINKYVNELNSILKKHIGYKPIKAERGIGQVIKFRD